MAIIVSSVPDSGPAAGQYNLSYLYLLSIVVALGGLLFGFDLSIISGTVHYFSNYYHLSEIGTGWAVGCINIGAAIGALISGKLSDRQGRKKLLIFCSLLFAVSGIGTGWASNFSLFIFFRMLSGVAVGIAALVCPMYIAEITPAFIRGKMVACYQLAITAGILLAYLSNYFLLGTGENNWRWMFTSQSAPAILFFVGLFFIAESPRWLIRKNRIAEANQVLEKIGGPGYAKAESESIQRSFYNEVKENIRDLFKKDVRFIILIGMAIAFFSQADGQNSLFSYAPEIFKKAGIGEEYAFLQSVILGCINFIFTFIAIFSIDRIGRKTLLLYGAGLLCLNAIAIALAFYFQLPGHWILVFVLGFIAIFAATLGPVTWVALSEIFPNRIRGNALSLATLTLWLANFFTTASFPVMQARLGLPLTFLIHAGICLLYFVIVKRFVPETKGKSLEQIEKLLVRN